LSLGLDLKWLELEPDLSSSAALIGKDEVGESFARIAALS
jgi:hypothetical protein